MPTGLLIFLMAVALLAGGLVAFLRNARQDLPKNLPPPLEDEPDEWDAKPGDRDPKP